LVPKKQKTTKKGGNLTMAPNAERNPPARPRFFAAAEFRAPQSGARHIKILPIVSKMIY